MSRPSLTARLLAGVVLAQLLLAAGLVWAGIVFTRRQLRRAFDAGLEGRLMSVAALVRYPEAGPGLIFNASLVPPSRNPRYPAFYQVRGPGGGVVANNFPATVALPAPGSPAASPWRFHYLGRAYRGLVQAHQPILDTEENLAGPPAQLTVYYAAPLLDLDEEVAAAGVAIGATSLVLLLLTSLLAAWAIRRELDPLRELAQQAAAISPRNWRFQPSPETAATPELRPLIAALERMLARLHASHEQQRAFMADAAHHLKTPVAILKSTLQALLRRPREREEYLAAAQASLLDVERLEQLLQRMLRLARLEQTSDPWAAAEARPLPPTEVGATCQAALERVQPLARARGIELRGVGLEDGHRLRADPDDLELVWVNLLENAVQHSPAGAAVELACAAAADRVRVRVRDQGGGIPAADVPLVFERFRRGADSPAGGFGLGLAIARAIVEAYGGSIAVEPQPPPGATLTVTLPLEPFHERGSPLQREVRAAFLGKKPQERDPNRL